MKGFTNDKYISLTDLMGNLNGVAFFSFRNAKFS